MELKPADTPEYKFAGLQQASAAKRRYSDQQLVNEWTKNADNAPGSAQAIELAPTRGLSGRCASGHGRFQRVEPWTGDVDPVPRSRFGDGAEDVHFGDIH